MDFKVGQHIQIKSDLKSPFTGWVLPGATGTIQKYPDYRVSDLIVYLDGVLDGLAWVYLNEIPAESIAVLE